MLQNESIIEDVVRNRTHTAFHEKCRDHYKPPSWLSFDIIIKEKCSETVSYFIIIISNYIQCKRRKTHFFYSTMLRTIKCCSDYCAKKKLCHQVHPFYKTGSLMFCYEKRNHNFLSQKSLMRYSILSPLLCMRRLWRRFSGCERWFCECFHWEKEILAEKKYEVISGETATWLAIKTYNTTQ